LLFCAKFQLACSESARGRSISKARLPYPSQSIAIEFDKVRAAHKRAQIKQAVIGVYDAAGNVIEHTNTLAISKNGE
jgi:formylglycine-generating enzyme required for sulfatase activity